MASQAPADEPATTGHTGEARLQAYARIVGIAYLVISAAGVLSISLIDSALIVSSDSAATTQNIVADGWLFRIGIVCVILIYLSVLVLSWAMYVLLEKVHRDLALLGMLARLAEERICEILDTTGSYIG